MPTPLEAKGLTPEVLRNEIVQNVDQMERIQVGNGDGFASAMSTFPLVNLDDPDEGYYTVGGVRGPMNSTKRDAESPIGTLDLPSKQNVDTEPYKKKYNPEKGTETALKDAPFSMFSRAASVLRLELFLTREQITWRGDSAVDGLIGQHGTSAHPAIPTGNVDTPATAWSDQANATIYKDMANIAHGVKTNGRLFTEQSMPYAFVGPDVMRDMRLNDDLQSRLSANRNKNLGVEDLNSVLTDDIAGVQQVMVYVPRTNANGEMIDDAGNVVDDADDAALDNILEPWDPAAGAKKRNVVIGRPGAGSAFIPWFGDALAEHATNVPPSGRIAVDNDNGFITQIWSTNDPVTSWFKAMQEVGFHLQTPENWAVLQNV